MQGQEWDYSVHEINVSSPEGKRERINGFFKDMGKQHWELVGISVAVSAQTKDQIMWAVFKRPKE
jgi:hypothetical protein